jgi:hypothetical protein
MAAVLAAKPEQMHSLRAFWLLLVPNHEVFAFALYVVTSLAVLLVAAQVWRRASEPALKMASLLIAMVLAAPHLYVYDLVVLAPVWIWLTDWYLAHPRLPRTIGHTLYVGFLAPLLAVLTAVTRLQLSVLCFGMLLLWLWRWSRIDQSSTASSMAVIRWMDGALVEDRHQSSRRGGASDEWRLHDRRHLFAGRADHRHGCACFRKIAMDVAERDGSAGRSRMHRARHPPDLPVA